MSIHRDERIIKMKKVYHIAGKNDWSEAKRKGVYSCESLKNEGFIHCSTQQQIIPVANRFYKGVKDLVLLQLDAEKVKQEIKYENLEGGEELFPHIYGPFDLDVVICSVDFIPDENGLFEFPDIKQ